jgi:hypothetical protein
MEEAEASGMPLFDHFDALSLSEHLDRLSEARHALAELPAGLSALVFHPVRDSREVRAMTPDWRSRVADHALFTDDALRHLLVESGVQVIGYRALRDAMRREGNF